MRKHALLVAVPYSQGNNSWFTNQILADVKMEVFCKLDRLFKNIVSLDADIEIGSQGNQQVRFSIKTTLDEEKEEDLLEVVELKSIHFFNGVLREKRESLEKSLKNRGNLDKTSNLLIG